MESSDEFYWDKQLPGNKTLVISVLNGADNIEYDATPFCDGFGLHLALYDKQLTETDTVLTAPLPKLLAKFVSEEAARTFINLLSKSS